MPLDELIGRARSGLVHLGDAWRRTLRSSGEVASGPAQGLRIEMGSDTASFLAGDYERPVLEAVSAMVRPGDVCYDVGANLGFLSLLMGRLAGDHGVVYAFEPVPANGAAIERNTRLNGLTNVRVVPLAVSHEDGSSELLLARHVGGAMLKSAGTPPDLAGRIMVATARLDTLAGSGKVRPPNFVKIDVEGAELGVLLGMGGILRRFGPKLLMEFDDQSERGCASKLSACRDFLETLGYRTEPLPHSYRHLGWFVRHFTATRD